MCAARCWSRCRISEEDVFTASMRKITPYPSLRRWCVVIMRVAVLASMRLRRALHYLGRPTEVGRSALHLRAGRHYRFGCCTDGSDRSQPSRCATSW